MWGGDQLSRGRRPQSGCKLPLLDPQVAREVEIVAANLIDEPFGVLAADELNNGDISPRSAGNLTRGRCPLRIRGLASPRNCVYGSAATRSEDQSSR